ADLRYSGTRRRNSPRPGRIRPRFHPALASHPWLNAMPAPWSSKRCPDPPYVYPPSLHSQLLALATQMPGHFGINVFEHCRDTGRLARQQGAVALCLLLGSDDFGLILLLRGVMF